MADSRSNQIRNSLSNNDLTDVAAAQKAATEIMRLYNQAGDSEKNTLKKQLSDYCEQIDDLRLVNLVYQLMKIDIENFHPTGGDDLYLRSSKNLASGLYGICAKRFNYFFLVNQFSDVPEPMRLLNQLICEYYFDNQKFPNKTADERLALAFKDILFKVQGPIIELLSARYDQKELLSQSQFISTQKISDVMNRLPEEVKALQSSLTDKREIRQIIGFLPELNSNNLAEQKHAAENAFKKIKIERPNIAIQAGEFKPQSTDKLIEDAIKGYKDTTQLQHLAIIKSLVQTQPVNTWVFQLLNTLSLFEKEKKNNKPMTPEMQVKVKKIGGPFAELLFFANADPDQQRTLGKLYEDIAHSALTHELTKQNKNMKDVLHDVFAKLGMLEDTSNKEFKQLDGIASIQLFQNVIMDAAKRNMWEELWEADRLKTFKTGLSPQYTQADKLYKELPVQTAVILDYMTSNAHKLINVYTTAFQKYGPMNAQNIASYLDELRSFFAQLIQPLIKELEGTDKEKYKSFLTKIERDLQVLPNSLLTETIRIGRSFAAVEMDRLANIKDLMPGQQKTLESLKDFTENSNLFTRIAPEVEIKTTNLLEFFEKTDGKGILDAMKDAEKLSGSKLKDGFSRLGITSAEANLQSSSSSILFPSAEVKSTKTSMDETREYLDAWIRLVNSTYWQGQSPSILGFSAMMGILKIPDFIKEVQSALKNPKDLEKAKSKLEKIQSKYAGGDKTDSSNSVPDLVKIKSKQELDEFVRKKNDSALSTDYFDKTAPQPQ